MSVVKSVFIPMTNDMKKEFLLNGNQRQTIPPNDRRIQ